MPYKEFKLPEYPYDCDIWDRLKKEERPIIVYGMGNGADKLIKRLSEYGIEVADFFASDGFVRGHSFHGKRVKSFSEIKDTYPDFVILLSFASNRQDVIDIFSELNKKYDFLIPDMPVTDENEYFDRNFYNKNYESIMKAYEALSDTDSKNLFAAVINYKLTGRLEYLLSAYSTKEEIYLKIGKKRIEVLIDAGAYNGDTLREAISFFPDLKKAYAIEPDKKTFKRLEKYVENTAFPEICALNAAAFSENGTGDFIGSGNRNSSVNSTASYQHKDFEIPLVRLDSVAASDKIDYVKYDVEGTEYEALLGSEGIIERDKPALLVSLYHRSKDIFFLINYLSEKYKDYDLILRRTLCVPAWEINLIMLPRT